MPHDKKKGFLASCCYNFVTLQMKVPLVGRPIYLDDTVFQVIEIEAD
jgi:hypothetical protein